LDYFLKEFYNNHDRVPDSELELLKTYYKNITNEKVRKQILSLLHTLANELS
jgi:hypothetical protein